MSTLVSLLLDCTIFLAKDHAICRECPGRQSASRSTRVRQEVLSMPKNVEKRW